MSKQSTYRLLKLRGIFFILSFLKTIPSPRHDLSLSCKKLSPQIGSQVGNMGRQAAETDIAIGTYKIQTRRGRPVALMHDVRIIAQHGTIPSQLWWGLVSCYHHVDRNVLGIVFQHFCADVPQTALALGSVVQAAEQ
jgi:hypothetical protein